MISACTFSASSGQVVTRTADARTSCSAWDIRSAATNFGSAVSSAITRTSLGPAIMSISTTPYSSFFAVATKILPGPTILSTFGISSVPYARAAIACAPPERNTRSTPQRPAATRISGFGVPSLQGGVTMMISFTPAIFAGTAFMMTLDGYAAVPPGTYRPTRSRPRTRCPRITPFGSAWIKPSCTWRWWKSRTFSMAFSIASTNAGSALVSASLMISLGTS